MRKAFILAGAAGLLTACGGETATYESEDGSMTVETDDDGRTEGTITTDDGSQIEFTANEGEATFPAGFSAYPGAEIGNSATMSQAGGSGAMIEMSSDDSADQIVAHYRGEAEAAGFTIDNEIRSGDMTMVQGSRNGEDVFSLMVSPSGGSNEIILTVSDGIS